MGEQDKVLQLRMQRLRLAVGASAVTVLLATLVSLTGYLPYGAAAIYAGIVAISCVAFYAIFRSGLNLRFPDPTLSVPQLVISALAVSFLVYEGNAARAIFMAMYIMAFMFGMFTLTLRGLIGLALFYVACFIAVIEISLITHPGQVDLNREIARLLVFIILLAWMTVLGSHVNGLRQHLRRSNEELKQALTRYQHLVEMSSDWYWEQDTQFRFTRVDGDLLGKSGIDPEALIGKTRWEAGYGEIQTGSWEDHIRVLESHQPFRDLEIARRDAEGHVTYAALVSGQPIVDAEGAFRGYRGVGRNITERKRMEETVARLAAYDELTDLPNARLFHQQLARTIAEMQRAKGSFSLLYCDLDGFKTVNDALGHQAGDAMLREVAARLKTTLREADMVARVGGDEFVALATTCRSRDDASRFAERMRNALSMPFRIGEREAQISCSIGIARYPDHAATAKGLLEAADKAMYSAKHAGRGRYAHAEERKS
jgi:diguanylate cyclase (GGDEF)-like protein/PAS domain S-box-containing protein